MSTTWTSREVGTRLNKDTLKADYTKGLFSNIKKQCQVNRTNKTFINGW